ncbi:2938_t:CDS:2, partial [Acaulospora colombiana]
MLRTGDERTRKAIIQDLRTRLNLHHQYLLPFLGLSMDLGHPTGSNATTPTSTYTPYSSSINGPFIISPYLANGSASYYLQLHPHANSLSILLGAAKGLSFLHNLLPQIVHGDVRGANILVDSSGEAVLADYGLFRLMNGGRGNARTTSQFSTLGGVNGTLGGEGRGNGMRSIKDVINVEGVRWAAPEIVCDQRHLEALIAQSNRIDGRSWNGRWGSERQGYGASDDFLEIVTAMSDVWSFGMTMYELLTGRLPYYQHVRDETVALAISLQELPKPPSAVNEVRTEWTPELWSLMQECWMIDRRRRPNVDELIRRLTSIVNQGLNALDLSKPPRPTVNTSTSPTSNGVSPVKKGSPMLQVPSGSPSHLLNPEASSSRHSLHGRHEQRSHGILKHHASAETLSYQKASRSSRNPEWFGTLRHSNSASALRHQMSIQSFHEPPRVTIVRPQRNNSILSNGTSPTVSPRRDKFPTTVRMDLLRSAELEVTLPPGMYIQPEAEISTPAPSYSHVDKTASSTAATKNNRDATSNGIRADVPQDAVQRDSLIDLNTEEDAEPAGSSENRSHSPSAMPFGKKWGAMTVTERRILLRECQLERQYAPTDDLSDHDWVSRLSAHGITLEALELRGQLGGVQIGLSNPRSGSVFSPSRSMSSTSRSQSYGATSPSSTSRASPYPVNMSSPISRASPHPGPSMSNRSIASPVIVHPTLSPASGPSSPVGVKFQPSPISPFSPCGLPYSSKEFMSSSWDVPAVKGDARSRSIFMEGRDSSSHGHDASSEYSPSQSHAHFWSPTTTENRNRGLSVSKNPSTSQPGPSQVQQARTRSPDLLPPPIWQNPSLQIKKKP